MDEAMMDFTMEELLEFLEADLHEVEADPEFKERLRARLWELIQTRTESTPGRGH